MMALMPVTCCRTARPRPILSGVRQRGANTSAHDGVLTSARKDSAIAASLRLGVMLRAESDERPERVVAATNLGVPPRGLDSDQNGEREEHARNRRDPQHRAPALIAGKRLVDEISDENADGDRELIRRDEPSTLRGGGEFRRIKRCGHRSDADAEASHEPADDEDWHVGGKGLYERADNEKSRRSRTACSSTKNIRAVAARERPEQGA